MGSRIMHLVIANQVADRTGIKDKASFILGGLAPDAAATKEISHFYEGDHQDYTRSINLDKFYQKYKDLDEMHYILGYYSHLIADDLWLKGFYMPWLKNRIEKKHHVLERYHNDFYILNGKLINYYKITKETVFEIENQANYPELEEVSVPDLLKFLPYIQSDFNCKLSDKDVELKVFTFDQIIGYIETSIEKSIWFIEKLIN